MRSSAKLSACRRYRYALQRIWDSDSPVVMFVGLNPSTADESVDDPTVRRCIGFARTWGFGGLILTNLFAFRSTDPKVLERVADPVGPENDYWVSHFSRKAGLTIAAWGAMGNLHDRETRVSTLLTNPQCLGLTKSRAPRHPLYMPASAAPRPFSFA